MAGLTKASWRWGQANLQRGHDRSLLLRRHLRKDGAARNLRTNRCGCHADDERVARVKKPRNHAHVFTDKSVVNKLLSQNAKASRTV